MILFKDLIRKKAFEKFYSRLIGENELCFDIGANTGYKSLILLSLNNKVIAFEPQTSCQKNLLNIKKKYPSLCVNKVAIGAENTELDLHIGNHIEIATLSNKFIDYFKTENIFWDTKERVKVVTLDSQIEKYGLPHFCKIDAEGYEYNILKNLHFKIPVIEFEFTGGFIEETLLCISKINHLGDYSFNYILNENPKFEARNWVSSETLKMKIENMSIQNLHGNIFAKLNQ